MTEAERKMFKAGKTAEYINGFNEGLIEGARRERRALRRLLANSFSTCTNGEPECFVRIAFHRVAFKDALKRTQDVYSYLSDVMHPRKRKGGE